MQAAFQQDCKLHFLQFSGLFGGNATQVELWSLIWFTTIWSIWCARNEMIFQGKRVDVGDLVEKIKLKSWLWNRISAKSPHFSYPVSNWFSNPAACVGLKQVNGGV